MIRSKDIYQKSNIFNKFYEEELLEMQQDLEEEMYVKTKQYDLIDSYPIHENNYITQQPKKRTFMNKKDQLNKLYQECNLTKEDVYEHHHYHIITRTGIEKIQYAKGIKVTFQPIEVQRDFCVIKAIGKLGSEVIETFGSAAKETTNNKYYMEMAEKRALSRVVLKLTKAYSLGVFGEEEADAFKQTVQSQKEQDARTNLKKLANK